MMIKVSSNGTVAGYKLKLSCQWPLSSASKERWKPHPGQSNPVSHLNGHGRKKISACSSKRDQADK